MQKFLIAYTSDGRQTDTRAPHLEDIEADHVGRVRLCKEQEPLAAAAVEVGPGREAGAKLPGARHPAGDLAVGGWLVGFDWMSVGCQLGLSVQSTSIRLSAPLVVRRQRQAKREERA